MSSTDHPLFSIIIATRNRSSLFAVALHSVLEQCFRDFEVIVVNDGSSQEHEKRYCELVGAAPELVRMLTLFSTQRGCGQGFGLNCGAYEAQGEYLCFLDDDDQWTDPEHLGRVARVISASEKQVDLLFANQCAFRDGTPVPGVVWIEDLKDRLRSEPDAAGAYTVTALELLSCPAHCHLNTTIVSRSFFMELSGIDQDQGYETDRDFFLRAIDRAQLIKYLPWVVSRHNIPDPAARANMSTLPELAKRIYQLRVFDRAVLFSVRPELRRYAMRQRAYVLKQIATEAARAGRFDCAAYYAREALMTGFNLGWLGITALFAVRRMGQSRRDPWTP